MFRMRLIFACIGALACLLAAGTLEFFFQRIHLAANLDDRVSRVLIIRSDISRRLEQAGGQSGEVQITLSWNNRNDLDLWCDDPYGERINYQHPHSRSGGTLDVDQNSSAQPLTARPVENIVWPYGHAPAGHYRVYVDHFKNNGGLDPTPFKVSILEKGRLHEITGAVSYDRTRGFMPRQPPLLVYQFDTTGSNSEWNSLLPAILRAALITGTWTALLALLFTSAVAGAQALFFHRYYKEQFLRPNKMLWLIGWGGLSGLIAGVVGQVAFSLLSAYVTTVPVEVGRYIGWVVLGGLFGSLIARRMPNLPRWAALGGGLVGGLLGAFALLASLRYGSGGWGRLDGATLLGAMVGLIIVLVIPYEEPIEPIEDLRMNLQPLRLRPQRGGAAGRLKSGR